MEDLIFASIVVLVGIGLHAAVLRVHSAREGQILTLSFAMHLAAGVGQVLLTRYYFKGGDMFGYEEIGVPMADALRSDFGLFFPALIEAFFQQDELSAPLELHPGGGSTRSMSAVSILLLYLLGNSLYAVNLFLATLSYLSKVMIFRALRDGFPAHLHRFVLIGVAALPSAVFWSSALLKEPVVMAALGPLVLGLRWFLARHRRALAVSMVVLSAIVISVIKPYVLMALSLAAAGYYLWTRLNSADSAALKPFAVLVAVLIAVGGLTLGNRYFIKAENDGAATAFAAQRAHGYAVQGGSNFSIEGGLVGEDTQQRTATFELLLAPLALFTALFRPLLFEARNAVQFVSAVEATMLLVLFVQVVRQRGLLGLGKAIRASPALVFCTLFTLALALGTGLSTTNMGTLSRYRAPMMPFFFMLLLVLRYEFQARREAERLDRLTPAGAAR